MWNLVKRSSHTNSKFQALSIYTCMLKAYGSLFACVQRTGQRCRQLVSSPPSWGYRYALHCTLRCTPHTELSPARVINLHAFTSSAMLFVRAASRPCANTWVWRRTSRRTASTTVLQNHELDGHPLIHTRMLPNIKFYISWILHILYFNYAHHMWTLTVLIYTVKWTYFKSYSSVTRSENI